VLAWVAAIWAKIKLGGASLSIIDDVDHVLETADNAIKGSQNAGRVFKWFGHSTADKREIDASIKSWRISLGAPVPRITLVYTVTNYMSVKLVPFTACAAFRLADVTVSGLTCANLRVIKSKDNATLVIAHNLTLPEIVALARYANAKGSRAETMLQLTCYRTRYWIWQKIIPHRTSWESIVGQISGTVSGWLTSPTDSQLTQGPPRSQNKRSRRRPRG
jgi:hypothetical protein